MRASGRGLPRAPSKNPDDCQPDSLDRIRKGAYTCHVTGRELIEAAAAHPYAVQGALASIPAAAFALGKAHRPGEGGMDPWCRAYTALVYSACVPGTFSASLVAYTLFFTKENLLDVSIAVYFAPIVQMALSLAVIRRNVDFEEIPGFDKIWGLMGVLGVTFTSVLFLQQTRIVMLFHGSFLALAAFAGALFFVLRASARALLGPGHRARP